MQNDQLQTIENTQRGVIQNTNQPAIQYQPIEHIQNSGSTTITPTKPHSASTYNRPLGLEQVVYLHFL